MISFSWSFHLSAFMGKRGLQQRFDLQTAQRSHSFKNKVHQCNKLILMITYVKVFSL